MNAESALATSNWQLIRGGQLATLVKMLKSAADGAGREAWASICTVALRARSTLLLSTVTGAVFHE
jgi:hypothetical protein